MTERSRLSPKSTPEKIRAARVDDARQSHLAIARAGRAPRSLRAALPSTRLSVRAFCRGHARNLTLKVGVSEVSSPITFGLHEMELID
jgi:hypothetical protein